MKRGAVAIVGLVIGVACGGSTAKTPTAPSAAAATPSATGTNYLNSILDIATRNSINRLIIDWNAYRTSVFADAGSAQSISDLTPAIRTAITLLRDGHSSYRSAAGTTIFVALRTCTAPAIVTQTWPTNIG